MGPPEILYMSKLQDIKSKLHDVDNNLRPKIIIEVQNY